MSDLKDRINDDVKAAMKSGDKPRLATLRMITAAIKQKEVDERIDPSDQDILTVLDKMAKQRRESIAQFEKAERHDLSSVEKNELAIIGEYMPAALTEQEIDTLVRQAVEDSGAASIKDMGKVMGQLKPKMQGRADMSAVSAKVRDLLNAG